MKTNGFREIDFSKTECKNCGQFQLGLMPYHGLQTAGKICEELEVLSFGRCNWCV